MTAPMGGTSAALPASRACAWLDDAVPDAEIASCVLRGHERRLALPRRRRSRLVRTDARRLERVVGRHHRDETAGGPERGMRGLRLRVASGAVETGTGC